MLRPSRGLTIDVRDYFLQSDQVTKPFQPIAIIGIGCRFPGQCDSPQAYWDLLQAGRDAISLTPSDRWSLDQFYCPTDTRPGKTQSKWGGYIAGIDRFDPQLFGISPREAASMDPQQRLLLETSYRAIEDAGVPVQSLAGQPVSVHVGIASIDYAVASLSFLDRGVIGPYSNTGVSSSIAANRISYCFDLRGESIAVDTACSSSLIATHLACMSLQSRSSNLALAGGVNALLLPDFFIAFSQLGVLSPEGRCKTFDASADGYVRSEGAGMVLLKRLDDAIADGDSIYAVIQGSASNQDGRTEGMTVPSADAQASLIRSALRSAELRGDDVSYVEAHGTGTPIGDPIEAQAISTCYGKQDQSPCRIGSVKTNIGHLEAGAGIASVIKVALAIKHRTIPAHLHFRSPNPKIDFQAAGLRVPTQSEPWDVGRQRLAGINGFGYGGANAHLILGEPPIPNRPSGEVHKTTTQAAVAARAKSLRSAGDPTPILLPISAHEPSVLAQAAADWADWLLRTDSSMESIAAAASRRRSHHDWRAAITGNTISEWIEGLKQLASDPQSMASERHVDSRVDAGFPPPIAFICGGQGPQWWAMGRELLESDPHFRETIERCDQIFARHVSWSLLDELTRDETASRMHQTSIAQPSLFALQVALAEFWRSKGIRPSFVVGHSVGEIAAAYLSGGLSFEDACLVAIHRGRTMDAATSKGAMIAVGLSVEEIDPWMRGLQDRVSIAAINGPTSLTLSGCDVTIGDLQRRLTDAGTFCRRLNVEYAFHSPQMEPVREPLLDALSSLRPMPTQTPMISTVTGGILSGEELDAEYWWKNVRDSVRFSDAMSVLADQGVAIAIELGPHPVLNYAINECCSGRGRSMLSLPSLHREQSDYRQVAETLGQLYRWGYPIDWESNTVASSENVKLPPLPMNRVRLWSESHESMSTRIPKDDDPHLGRRVDGPIPAWETRVDLRLQDDLSDHRVRDACVLPAAAVVNYVASAASKVKETTSVSIRRLRLRDACLLDEEHPVRLQIAFKSDRQQVVVSKCQIDESDWKELAIADWSSSFSTTPVTSPDLTKLHRRLSQIVSSEQLYSHCGNQGLNYGLRFRGVTQAKRGEGESFVWVDLTQLTPAGKRSRPFGLTAGLLDSCFHGMVVADPDFGKAKRNLYLPQKIGSIDCYEKVSLKASAHVRIVSKNDDRMVSDIDIFNDDGRHCLAIRGFESVCVAGTPSRSDTDELLFRYVWRPAEKSTEDYSIDPGRKWLIFTDQTGTAATVADRFPVNDRVITVQHGTSFKRIDEDSFIIDPEDRDHFDRLLMDTGDEVSDIVFFWGLDAPDNVELSEDSLVKSTILTTTAPLHLVAAWQTAAERGTQSQLARLALITQCAQPPDETMMPITVSGGPLIGFGRVVASECGQLKTKLIDLSNGPNSSDYLIDELVTHCDQEDEVMIRDSIRWVRRFVPSADQPIHRESSHLKPCTLRCGVSSSIGDLRYETIPDSMPDDDEIEIEVVASGLNFSDVMKALDLYPGLPDGPVVLGAECSGRVRRVGRGVTGFQVGQDVIAVAPGSFATTVHVNKHLVARKPKNLSHAEAATIPIAFLTAQYALSECARLRKGERVLIHSASGGVGLAAIQVARSLGATVLGTAGTEEKREHVRQLGVSCVMDSRTLNFARQTLQHTHGHGVDAVLNSLPGEAIPMGLSTLRTGGRFLEIGKRDIYADAPLGLEPLKNNLALFAIDLDQLFREKPEQMGELLGDIVDKFDRSEFSVLPSKVFAAEDTRDAFRLMQQGKHIGKVVIEYRNPPGVVFNGRLSRFA